MLKDDHKTAESLFRRFEKAGNGAYVEKRDLVDRIVEELSKHAAVEEQLFYPVARATVPDTDDVVLESLEEHHVVKWLLSELDAMDPHEERFDAKVTVLIENVRHHVKEEEQEFFPQVRDALGRNALADLGDAMLAAKKAAPTHPHPRSPDTPPGNLVAGAATGVVDRLGDTMSGLTQGSVTAVGDLVALILRRKKPRVAPSGSRLARRTATDVRSGASAVTDAAIEAARDAKRTGEATVKRTTGAARRTRRSAGANSTVARRGVINTARAAKAGVKGTTTTARKSARRTATTAKRASTTTGRTARAAATNTATTAKRAGQPGSSAGANSTVRSARRGVRSTARAAKAGVKGTTTTARRSTRHAARTAKRASTTTGRTARTAATKKAATAKRTASRRPRAARSRGVS